MQQGQWDRLLRAVNGGGQAHTGAPAHTGAVREMTAAAVPPAAVPTSPVPTSAAPAAPVQAALVVDSPWIPGFLGISTIDYIALPDVWLKANLEVCRRFPEVIFLPGFWVEPGMAAEPSGFGCRVTFARQQTPSIHAAAETVEAASRLEPPNPHADGLMPLVLAQYRSAVPRVRDEGMDIRIAAARGPLALASHLVGLTELLIGLKTEPDAVRRLLRMTTNVVSDWLEAQAEVLPGFAGVMVLDDVIGFLSPADYREFAHPLFKEIFNLPVPVKILHNDSDSSTCYDSIADLGVNIFQFSHLRKIDAVRGMVGDGTCLLGSVPPLDILVNGTPDQAYAGARECMRLNKGHPRFLLSAGGGVSPGTPAENIDALCAAARDSMPAASKAGEA